MKWLLVLAMLIAAPAIAQDRPLTKPEQEAAARSLFHELKCVVCEGQNIADSNAKLAGDMRSLIRTKVARGESSEEILAFFTDRYGDEVLMEPPVEAHTYLLWLGPFALLLAGAWIIRKQFKGTA